MIVRIATEGQYRIAEDRLARLRELDGAVVAAGEAGDERAFADSFAALLAFVRAGDLLHDDHLGPSDAILPPPDASLHEATRELRADGLIPG